MADPWASDLAVDESALFPAQQPAAAAPWSGDTVVPEPSTTQPLTLWSQVSHGMADPFYGGAQLGARLSQTPGAGVPEQPLAPLPPDRTAEVDAAVRQREQAYQGQRQAAGQTGTDWARLTGNVLSPMNLAAVTVGPGAGIPAMMTTGALSGALSSAMQPYAGDPEGFARALVERLLGGAGTGAALGPVSSLVTGRRAPDVQMLEDAGMRLTPAQSGGLIAKTMAAIGQKTPVVGNLLGEQQREAVDSFTPALMNQILEPIGAALPKGTAPGHEAFEAAHNAVSGYYQDLMPRLSYTPSDGFLDGLASIESKVPLSKRGDFNRAIAPLFTDSLSGDALKTVDSDLATFTRRYKAATMNPEAVDLGYAVGDARNLLHQRLAELNPASAAELKNANRASAMLRVADDAVTPTSEGKVTPAQVLSASSRSATDAQFSQGRALLQPFAEAAQRVVGSTRGVGNRPLTMRDLLITDIVGPAIGVGSVSAAESGYGPDWLKYGAAAALPAMMMTRPVMRGFGPAGMVRRGLGGMTQTGPAAAVGGYLNNYPGSFAPF